MTNKPIKVLFFSRGRGHGHAIPDMAVVNEIASHCPRISFTFVSYATGAETFRTHNVSVIDMGLPENNSYLNTFFTVRDVIAEHKPRVVVAHEEFAAIAAAHLFNIPSIFVSAWLPTANSIGAESLTYASSVIVIDDPGVFPTLPNVKAPVFVGPILRKMQCALSDRARIRSELGIAENTPVILTVSGGWANENRAPLVDLVLSAFFELRNKEKRLLFVATKGDFELITLKTQGIQGVEVIAHANPIERLIVASDVVLTKATRGITLDAAGLGVPSISISYGLNPIDDALVPRVPSNIPLNARATSPDVLCAYIKRIIDVPFPQREKVRPRILPRNGLTPAGSLIDAINTAASKLRSTHSLSKSR